MGYFQPISSGQSDLDFVQKRESKKMKQKTGKAVKKRPFIDINSAIVQFRFNKSRLFFHYLTDFVILTVATDPYRFAFVL